MSKVAINKCYGGFSISKECAKRLENEYGIDLSKEYDCGAYYFIVLEDCHSGLYNIEEYDGYETLITPDDERERIKIEG